MRVYIGKPMIMETEFEKTTRHKNLVNKNGEMYFKPNLNIYFLPSIKGENER